MSVTMNNMTRLLDDVAHSMIRGVSGRRREGKEGERIYIDS